MSQRFVQFAGLEQLLGEVAVGDRAPRAVADALELRDRSPVELDRAADVAELELDHAEIEQAAADLLDVADALGDRQAAPQRRRGLVRPADRRVDVPLDPQRAGDSAEVLLAREDPLGVERVGERRAQAAVERLHPCESEQELAGDVVDPAPGVRQRGLEHGGGFLEPAGDRQRPAALELHPGVVRCTVEQRERLVVPALLAQRCRRAAPGTQIAVSAPDLRVEAKRLVVLTHEVAELGEGERDRRVGSR